MYHHISTWFWSVQSFGNDATNLVPNTKCFDTPYLGKHTIALQIVFCNSTPNCVYNFLAMSLSRVVIVGHVPTVVFVTTYDPSVLDFSFGSPYQRELPARNPPPAQVVEKAKTLLGSTVYVVRSAAAKKVKFVP